MKRLSLDLGEYRPHLRAPGLGTWKWDKALTLVGKPGVLRLGFWGCGSAFATNQFQSNLVIVKGHTVVFLDLGTKLPIKLAEFGMSMHDVQNVIVTHSHADHSGSLEELGLRRRYEAPLAKALAEGFELPPKGNGEIFKRMEEMRRSGETRAKLYIPGEYATELWGQTLRGGMAHSEEVDLGGPKGRMSLSHFFDLQPMVSVEKKMGRQAWEFEVGEGRDKIHFLMYVSPHIPDTATNLKENFFSAGLILDGRVMVSGDTRFDPEAINKFGKNCQTIFNDCQSFPGGVHVHYDELCTLSAETRKRMMLYHCDDGMRPLNINGKLSGKDVQKDGFAGYAEPIPVFYEWE